MKFTLLIITLNEIESSKIIIPQIDKSLFHEILVIDGGSTDGTIEFMKENNFKVIIQNQIEIPWYNFAKKQTKIASGVAQGIEASTGDILILFTPDGNMMPQKLKDLIKTSKQGYDLVCVSRYKDDAKSMDDNIVSGFGNFFFTFLVNILFNGNFTDVLGGYKAVKKELWEKVNKNNKLLVSFGTQISIACAKNNLKYSEIPGDEPKRLGGKSSTSIFVNGCIELYTILKAFIFKNEYKF